MASDTKLTASAGEHFVCSMLARHGWAASLTRDGLARTDILAVHAEDRQMIEVQVKTTRSSNNWPLGRKGTLHSVGEREWYVFVVLGSTDEAPETFVVPRDHVAAATWIGHMTWLTSGDAPPGKRNAGIESARINAVEWEGYRDRWDELKSSTREVPVRLPEWMQSMIDDPKVGLPDGHPWNDAAQIPSWPGP